MPTIHDYYKRVYMSLRSMGKVQSKEDFATKLGYSETHGSRMMTGNEPITDGVIMKLYEVFGINVGFMKGRSKSMFADMVEPEEGELLKILKENNKLLKAINKKLQTP
jgi:hypothetical protein